MARKDRQSRKDRRRERKNDRAPVSFRDDIRTERVRRSTEPFKPKNAAQRVYVATIHSNILTFGLGPAGTGKTHCAVAIAAEMLEEKMIERIVITRPAVEAGESLGFLPGELEEKFAPYLAPVAELLYKSLGQGVTEAYLANGKILVLPLAYMRGHTFENSFIIADEMQNASKSQMQMLLTRVGNGSKIVVNGDLAQKDIPGMSGMSHAPDLLRGLSGVGCFTFKTSDIVRSGFVEQLISRYNNTVNDNSVQDYSSNEFTEDSIPQFIRAG